MCLIFFLVMCSITLVPLESVSSSISSISVVAFSVFGVLFLLFDLLAYFRSSMCCFRFSISVSSYSFSSWSSLFCVFVDWFSSFKSLIVCRLSSVWASRSSIVFCWS